MAAPKTITELSQLQNLVKRDPESYREEFDQQYRHFHSLYAIVVLAPSKDTRHFEDLATFVAHVVHVYPDKAAEFPALVVELLEDHAAALSPRLRKTLVRCLVLCRNKGLVDPLVSLSLAFKLFRVNDKVLRETLFNHIVSDIRNMNKKRINNKVNSALQSMLFGFLQDASKTAAKCALDVIIALYRKRVWIDAKTVNVIASGCFAKDNTKMLVAALKFFVSDHDLDLGAAGDDDDDSHIKKEEFTNVTAVKAHFQHSSKTRSRQRKLERALRRVNKTNSGETVVKKKKKPEPQFTAIELLYDGQSFAERLFGLLRKSKERFEVRLLMMDMIARTIAAHELVVLNFYPFMQRYMQPHQQHAILILSIVAQAVHPLVPDDVILPVLQTLLFHFVTDRSSADVITVGLNTAREICRRHPDAITEDLLADLVMYKSSKFKGVAMAARSLLQLYRNVRPEMLHRRLRGKEASMAITERKRKALEDANAISNDDDDDGGDDEAGSGRRVRFEGVSDDDGGDDDGEWVDLDDADDDPAASLAAPAERLDRGNIDRFRRRKKMTAKERLEWVRAGRPEARHEHFRDTKIEKNQSKTNMEKKSTKNYLMLQRSAKVRFKSRESLTERNDRQRKHRRSLKRRRKK
ncbi:mystery 45A [Thecamonas trahens ATCC 50062]|uniref:Protein SDA1 n=1 Tax=Thecamonas trahens ATCC 50062 TaxID=461836 RepID=A0A0L0DKD8_THETB|nr:mystery 45A [Thecamonas trahens ATCC 50062]KNC52670.1 mystery 45A [Thecamonas trahens ATCC 50062]|eukprot:XP_013755219.1 mystery 45A [Thecamonas trahens ATCC 50062]